VARKKKEKTKLAVIDFETDPFKFGRKPEPFAAGFYDGENYKQFWGEDCVTQLICHIETLKTKHIIYAHNGGKFDFFYLLEKNVLQNPALIISGRIVKCRLLDIHELRDSYAILPLPLSKLGDATASKKEIDYELMEKDKREKHKKEILEYLKSDCVTLFNIVDKFQDRYPNKITVGAMAISELGKHHYVSKQNRKHDERFRPFYFGGRVSCFENGEIKAPAGRKFKFYDVNSMYPKAMRDFDHPSGSHYINLTADNFSKFNHRTGKLRNFTGMYFMRFIGHNKNALPTRDEKTGGLKFDVQYGEFFACSHEIEAASELGLIKVEKIISIHVPCNVMRFDIFVDTYIQEKITAQKAGLFAETTFAKLTLNSAYGKFATDVDKFKEWFILDTWESERIDEFDKWREENKLAGNPPILENDLGRFEIWSCKSPDEKGFFDVAVAASITSASRSILLRAIHASERPIYCDTDSLLCLDIGDVEISDTKLGAWKFEGSTDLIYVAGKKMYAAKLDQLDKHGTHKIKMASKGARLNYDDIVAICRGEVINWRNDAPNFSIKMTPSTKCHEITTKFVERKIKKII